MLKWAFILLLLATVAGVLGFAGLAGEATDIVRTLFFVLLFLVIVTALIGAFQGRRTR
jgi:uncharacterized membrane protein YtjA (UPF0391 family)